MNNTDKITMNRAANGTVTINIEGTIGVREDWQFDSEDDRVATYEKFRATLDSIRAIDAANVTVNIRSRGGSVEDALMIYEALATLSARVETVCHGYVASAATIIAQAGDHRKISTGTLYLIHRATMSVDGNRDEIISASALLDKTDERIAQLYASRSGLPVEEFRELMSLDSGRGEWLSPEEAVAAGLADEVVNLSRIAKLGKKIKDFMTTAIAVENQVQGATVEVFEVSKQQKEAKATRTLPKEDPTVDTISRKINANQSAYNQDVEAFRSVIV